MKNDAVALKSKVYLLFLKGEGKKWIEDSFRRFRTTALFFFFLNIFSFLLFFRNDILFALKWVARETREEIMSTRKGRLKKKKTF